MHLIAKKILVHICCAPDALYVLDILKNDFDVSGYFYNPNIHPKEEYDLRLSEARRVAQSLNVFLYEDKYDTDRWYSITQKYQLEAEKGKRCDICYAMRLEKTALKAKDLNFESFTTVMSLSPMKKADVLNKIGLMFAQRHGIEFLEANFKKKDGFRKSVELSKRHNLYRQNYCGCEFSRR